MKHLDNAHRIPILNYCLPTFTSKRIIYTTFPDETNECIYITLVVRSTSGGNGRTLVGARQCPFKNINKSRS